MSSRFSSEDTVHTKERKDTESPHDDACTHKCTPVRSYADYGCTNNAETLLIIPFALLSSGKHDQLRDSNT